MEHDLSTLAKRLAWAREKTGLSQRGLADLAGLSGGSVGLLETEVRTKPEASTVAKLTAVLGCSMEWLLLGAGAGPTDEQVQAAVGAARAARAEANGDAA